jgi:hypothetical protein
MIQALEEEYREIITEEYMEMYEEEQKNEGFAVCVTALLGVSAFSLWLLWDLVMLVWRGCCE